MFFKGCQIVVVWRTSQWNLCKISLYRKWILSSERAKCVFSNFKKRTHYLGKLTTACFITHLGLSMSQKWAESNLNLCRPWVDIYGKPQRFHRYSRWYLKNSLTWGIDGWHRGGEKKILPVTVRKLHKNHCRNHKAALNEKLIDSPQWFFIRSST